MSDIKWIKITVDMFEDSKIEFLRNLPEGDSIIVIWLQLLSISGKSNANGYLMITEGIPYTEQLLSNTLRRNPVLMQYALETFLKLKMVNVEDGPFHITKWEKYQSAMRMEEIKSKSALKQARYRDRQKEKQLLLEKSNENVTNMVTSYVTKGNSYQADIELELEKEKEKEYTHAFDDFTRVSKVYAAIHGVLEMPYSNSPLLTKLLKDGISADHIIGIIREKHRPGVKTLKFYEGAIRDSWDVGRAGALRSRGLSHSAARQEPNYVMREFTAEELEALPRG